VENKVGRWGATGEGTTKEGSDGGWVVGWCSRKKKWEEEDRMLAEKRSAGKKMSGGALVESWRSRRGIWLSEGTLWVSQNEGGAKPRQPGPGWGEATGSKRKGKGRGRTLWYLKEVKVTRAKKRQSGQTALGIPNAGKSKERTP